MLQCVSASVACRPALLLHLQVLASALDNLLLSQDFPCRLKSRVSTASLRSMPPKKTRESASRTPRETGSSTTRRRLDTLDSSDDDSDNSLLRATDEDSGAARPMDGPPAGPPPPTPVNPGPSAKRAPSTVTTARLPLPDLMDLLFRPRLLQLLARQRRPHLHCQLPQDRVAWVDSARRSRLSRPSMHTWDQRLPLWQFLRHLCYPLMRLQPWSVRNLEAQSWSACRTTWPSPLSSQFARIQGSGDE